MTTPEVEDRLDVLRRIGERGRTLALDEAPQLVDLFQHFLDELELLKKALSST